MRLGSVIGKAIGKLSKGYRQRVGMAQVLLHEPDVLILDEPTAGLDPNQIRDVRDTIRRLGESKTILLSTHILQEVEAMASRVLFINEGRLVYDGAGRRPGPRPRRAIPRIDRQPLDLPRRPAPRPAATGRGRTSHGQLARLLEPAERSPSLARQITGSLGNGMNLHVIRAIFRRNFVSYFSNPTGYVFICVFVLLSSHRRLLAERVLQREPGESGPAEHAICPTSCWSSFRPSR